MSGELNSSSSNSINLFVILLVDGAGGGHGASVFCYYGDVGGAVVFRQVKLGLVIVHVMCGSIGDLFTQAIGVERRSHVLDELLEEQTWTQE